GQRGQRRVDGHVFRRQRCAASEVDRQPGRAAVRVPPPRGQAHSPEERGGPVMKQPILLVVGGGLFGSPAVAYARSKGIETLVFDAGLSGAASHSAAGLFQEAWVGRKWKEHYALALPLLDR